MFAADINNLQNDLKTQLDGFSQRYFFSKVIIPYTTLLAKNISRIEQRQGNNTEANKAIEREIVLTIGLLMKSCRYEDINHTLALWKASTIKRLFASPCEKTPKITYNQLREMQRNASAGAVGTRL